MRERVHSWISASRSKIRRQPLAHLVRPRATEGEPRWNGNVISLGIKANSRSGTNGFRQSYVTERLTCMGFPIDPTGARALSVEVSLKGASWNEYRLIDLTATDELFVARG